MKTDSCEIPEDDIFRQMGFRTPKEKSKHHQDHKIPLSEAKGRPEFWIVNTITATRILLDAYSLYLTFTAIDRSHLILPAILIATSWIADYADGELARKWGVCTDEGREFDHTWGDKLLQANTAFIFIRSILG